MSIGPTPHITPRGTNEKRLANPRPWQGNIAPHKTKEKNTQPGPSIS
jgi:hypothetical protein